MFSKKITRVVVLTLVIVFMFSSVAFSSDNVIRDFIKNAMEKVFINGVEVPHIKQDNVIYVPVDTLALTGARIRQEISGLKVDTLYDTDTAYKELKEMYARHIERVKNPIAGNTSKAVDMHRERYGLVCTEISKLDSFHIRYGSSDIDNYLFLSKTFLHTVLNNEMLIHAGVYQSIAENNKSAKKDLQELESALILYGNHTASAFAALDDAYEEFKEAK